MFDTCVFFSIKTRALQIQGYDVLFHVTHGKLTVRLTAMMKNVLCVSPLQSFTVFYATVNCLYFRIC